MSPFASVTLRRLHASWAVARGVVLALGFCALYAAVDLRLADAPTSALTWPRILVGAVAWIVVLLTFGRQLNALWRQLLGDDDRAPAPRRD